MGNMSRENDTKTNEAYPLKDINNKTDETTPLTKNDDSNENNLKETSGLDEKLSLEKDTETAQSSKKKTITLTEEIFQNRNIRIIIGAIFLIILLLSILVIIAILIIAADNDDSTHRFLRVVPKPRGRTNLIYYRHGDLKPEAKIRSWKDMVKEIDEFLAPYKRPNPNVSLCLVNNRNMIDENKVCKFDLNTIDKACLKEDYGYMAGSPCIFIVFNNISDWVPALEGNDTTNIVDLECSANTQFDAENIGPMEFTPFQGFSSIYFPYKNQPDYSAPFVALRLSSPTQNVGIGLTCRLLAPNLLQNSTQEPVPYIPFNIYIE